MKILLNCDLGEGEGAATTAALLELADLANIACGGHAGDEETMRRVVRGALARGVQVGAHPGWPDRASFGRGSAEVDGPRLARLMTQQVGALRRVAAAEGVPVRHVKLHGVLYHLCDERAELAEACVDWMYAEAGGAALVVGAGGLLHAVAEARGVPLLREIFAERGYAEEGRLVPRGEAGDVIGEVAVVRERLKAWLETGFISVEGGKKWMVEAETVCVHADSPASVATAQAVRELLHRSG
jgi:UPF0271 protein